MRNRGPRRQRTIQTRLIQRIDILPPLRAAEQQQREDRRCHGGGHAGALPASPVHGNAGFDETLSSSGVRDGDEPRDEQNA